MLGGIWNRELLLLAAVFAVVLLIWQRQIDRAPRHPWVLTVDEGAVSLEALGTTKVARRAEVRRVKRRRRTMRYAAWTELVFEGTDLVVGPSATDLPAIVTALRERGWPA